MVTLRVCTGASPSRVIKTTGRAAIENCSAQITRKTPTGSQCAPFLARNQQFRNKNCTICAGAIPPEIADVAVQSSGLLQTVADTVLTSTPDLPPAETLKDLAESAVLGGPQELATNVADVLSSATDSVADVVSSASDAAAQSSSVPAEAFAPEAVKAASDTSVTGGSGAGIQNMSMEMREASLWMTGALFVITLPGFYSLVVRSTKSKVKKAEFSLGEVRSDRQEQFDGVAQKVIRYFIGKNYRPINPEDVAEADFGPEGPPDPAEIIFEGEMKAELSKAAYLSFCVCIAFACVAFILSITLSFGGNNWYLMTPLGLAAGYWYYQNGDKVERVRARIDYETFEGRKGVATLKMVGSEDELERFKQECADEDGFVTGLVAPRRERPTTEKGFKVYSAEPKKT